MIDITQSPKETPDPGSADKVKQAPESRLRLALLIASSAALSGIAVVFWNRRALQHMRQQELGSREPELGSSRSQPADNSEFI